MEVMPGSYTLSNEDANTVLGKKLENPASEAVVTVMENEGVTNYQIQTAGTTKDGGADFSQTMSSTVLDHEQVARFKDLFAKRG